MARLAGRKIIITGGASGIGRATARLFRREGAAVAILDRSDNAAKAVADEIGAVGETFGADYPGFARLNFATPPAILEEIVTRMAEAVRRR